MAEEINARIRHVGKTESQWLADSTVLLAGELGYATDTQVIKIGNGQDVWRDLKSHQGEQGLQGPKGEPFTFDDLTEEQIDAIRGAEIDTSRFVKRTELNDQLADKANVNHTHTISDISNLLSRLDSKASRTHLHDDRYSKIGHTHSEYALKSEVPKIKQVTQSEYDRLSSKDSNTLYVVVG